MRLSFVAALVFSSSAWAAPVAPMMPDNPVIKVKSKAPRVLFEQKTLISALSRAPDGGLWCVDSDSWSANPDHIGDRAYRKSVHLRRLTPDGRDVEQVALPKTEEDDNARWFAFSRDGSLVAAILISRHPVTPQYTATLGVDVWDIKTRSLKWHLVPKQRESWDVDDVVALDFSPSGRELVTASETGQLTQWNMNTGRPTRTTELKARVTALSFSPDGATLAMVAKSFVRLLDARNFQIKADLLAPKSSQMPEGIGLNTLAWSPDGKHLAASAGTVLGQNYRNEVCVWNVSSRRLVRWFGVPLLNSTNGLGWSPDSRRLFIARRNYDPGGGVALDVWDILDGRLLLSLRDTEKDISRAQFSPDGHELLAVHDTKIKAWDLTPTR